MQNHEFGVGERLVGVLLDRVELDALARAELDRLMRQRDAEAAARDPAHLGVVMVDLGTADLGAFQGGAEVGDDIGVFYLAELEVTGAVGFLRGAVHEIGLAQGEQVGGAQTKGAGEAVKRIELGRLLVALKLGDDADGDAGGLEEVGQGQIVLVTQGAQHGEVEFMGDGRQFRYS